MPTGTTAEGRAEVFEDANDFLYNAINGCDATSLLGQGARLAQELGYPDPQTFNPDPIDITIAAQQRLASGPRAGQLYEPGMQPYDALDHVRGFSRTIAEADGLRRSINTKVGIIHTAIDQAMITPDGAPDQPFLRQRSRVAALHELSSAVQGWGMIPRSEVELVRDQLARLWKPANVAYGLMRYLNEHSQKH